MTKKSIISLLCIILFQFVFACKISNKSRPLTITVIDSQKGLPIKGIKVEYHLTEKKLKFSINNIFPVGGGSYHFYYTEQIKFTDDLGNVHFENMNKLGKKYEEIENIYINITDKKNSKSTIFVNGSTNLNKKYFGYFIQNFNHCVDNPNDWGASPVDGIDVLINGGSLRRSSENIIVKLRNYDSINSKGKRFEIKCNE